MSALETETKFMDCLEEITRFELTCDLCGVKFEHNVSICDRDSRFDAASTMIEEGWAWDDAYGPICPICKDEPRSEDG